MVSLAVLYLLLGAEFIAAVQMIVYAGAIMVLFVFVIMLLNAGAEKKTPGRSRMVKWFGIPLFALLLGLISLHHPGAAAEDGGGQVRQIHGGRRRARSAAPFSRNYLLPFEVVSILILIAILGAVVLATEGDLMRASDSHDRSRFPGT